MEPKSNLTHMTALAAIAVLVGGCATAAPLDDAQLTSIALASPDDLERYERARTSDLLASNRLSLLHDSPPDWPTIKLSFRSSRILFVSSDTWPRADAYVCDEIGDQWHLPGFGQPRVMWQGRLVNPAVAEEIAAVLQAEETPQEYEIFFSYAHYRRNDEARRAGSVTLSPLPGDLCLSLVRSNYPFPQSVGRPLRIDKDRVTEAVGDLPRQFPVP